MEPPSSLSSPPPILHPLNPHSTHLAPPIHENWPLEILNLDSLHDLPVEGVIEGPGHPHAVVYIPSALMMMNAMKPQYRLVLVTSFKVVEVLSPSSVSIPLVFSKVVIKLQASRRRHYYLHSVFMMS